MSKQTDFSFIRYANCWEDTDILLEALDINKNKVGLSIASAGDNTLAMLSKNPKKVYAFDLNKTQLYLMELKMAAIRNFEREDALRFLGVKQCKERVRMYNQIEDQMSDEARTYFAINLNIVDAGVIHTGKFEHYFHIFKNSIAPILIGRKYLQKWATMENIDEQVEFYNTKINNRRFKALFKIYFGSKVMGKLGRDKNFYKYVEDEKESGSDIKSRVEYGIKHVPNRNNSYLNYIAFGTFNENALPFYLRKENYENIKKNLDKVELVYGDLFALKERQFDFFNLSDIFEYMSEKDFNKNVRQILKISNKGARIAYWNMQNKRYIKNYKLDFLSEESEELFKKNNSWFYRDFCIYKKAGKNE